MRSSPQRTLDLWPISPRKMENVSTPPPLPKRRTSRSEGPSQNKTPLWTMLKSFSDFRTPFWETHPTQNSHNTCRKSDMEHGFFPKILQAIQGSEATSEGIAHPVIDGRRQRFGLQNGGMRFSFLSMFLLTIPKELLGMQRRYLLQRQNQGVIETTGVSTTSHRKCQSRWVLRREICNKQKQLAILFLNRNLEDWKKQQLNVSVTGSFEGFCLPTPVCQKFFFIGINAILNLCVSWQKLNLVGNIEWCNACWDGFYVKKWRM